MTSQSSRNPSRASSSGALWSSVALLVVLCAPAALRAQQTDSTARPSTHTVKTGDTLWDLARVYLGDPFLWPEIYRVNTDVVEDPHWIYPGEVLRIPGGVGGEPAIAVATPSGEPSDSAAAAEMEVIPSGPTLFHRIPSRRAASSSLQDGNLIDRGPAVRSGEYYSAPFVISDRDQKRAGRLVGSTEIEGIAAAHERMVFQNQERVYITNGQSTPAAGDRYVSYRLGPDLAGIGQVVIPTGIVVVERPGTDEASTVRIIRQFEEITMGQKVLPLEEFVSPPAADLTPVESGPTSRIAWIFDEPQLASLQSFFIVKVGARDGVKLGDQFRVYRERTKTEDGVRIPAEDIAMARVVRVTDRATTLVVTGQRNPAIREGARTQLAARMP
ncbi:MAG TPA: LysM peptidoglycan-binding domain-containing protein [Gemmatimonadaceae bacterium]|nr:LysM peptidoglycan-binding domain-containing protein [Gemmatimonadaceae bacterium]